MEAFPGATYGEGGNQSNEQLNPDFHMRLPRKEKALARILPQVSTYFSAFSSLSSLLVRGQCIVGGTRKSEKSIPLPNDDVERV